MRLQRRVASPRFRELVRSRGTDTTPVEARFVRGNRFGVRVAETFSFGRTVMMRNPGDFAVPDWRVDRRGTAGCCEARLEADRVALLPRSMMQIPCANLLVEGVQGRTP